MYGEIMDRRQKKTREAIFSAFTQLLAEKNINSITVSDIIERADIGRATFYAHFETKDFLIKELCEELFCHIFDSTLDTPTKHNHIFECDSHDSLFLHILKHIKNNDNQILKLLSCQNNELFLNYFKNGLLNLIEIQLDNFENEKSKELPKDFYTNFIASTFVQTVKWWIDNKLIESPELINEYFLKLI